jgi:predicted HTH domain antitoxin
MLEEGIAGWHFGGMSTLKLEVPWDAVAPLGRDDAERQRVLLLELALALYREGKLPPGHAAELAGVGRWEFTDIAKSRDIPTPYTREMIEEDFTHGGRH